MAKTSAGILLFRIRGKELEVLLVHPGGPFWKSKDEGSWTIPKGEPQPSEELLAAAIREFGEETGFSPDGDFIPLTPVKQKSGKFVYSWAIEGNLEIESIKSNFFEIEWPPHSGKKKEFPEIDKAGWFTISEGTKKINAAQAALLTELKERISK